MKDLEGVVIKSTGSWYTIQTPDGTSVECRIQGKFRLKGGSKTNPLAVGDNVVFSMETHEERGIITELLPRKNYVVRQSTHKRVDVHVLVANIDQALLFVTLRAPNLKVGFIDRFLLMTAPFDIPTTIVVNKADLYDDEDLEVFEGLKAVYEPIGYQLVLASAVNGQGIEAIKTLLKDKISFVSGHSGVGKSTVINALEANLNLRTQELSDYSGKGQHTTTFAEMHPLSFGGYIIDTPGIKSLAFNHLTSQDVAHNFLEFFKTSSECRFYDCLHINEPGCAVKKAVESGKLSVLRYENYLQILSEIDEQNYWELHKEV